MIPLVIVLSITAAKDAFDDIVSVYIWYGNNHVACDCGIQKRHVSDYRINNRSVTILTDAGWGVPFPLHLFNPVSPVVSRMIANGGISKLGIYYC